MVSLTLTLKSVILIACSLFFLNPYAVTVTAIHLLWFIAICCATLFLTSLCIWSSLGLAAHVVLPLLMEGSVAGPILTTVGCVLLFTQKDGRLEPEYGMPLMEMELSWFCAFSLRLVLTCMSTMTLLTWEIVRTRVTTENGTVTNRRRTFIMWLLSVTLTAVFVVILDGCIHPESIGALLGDEDRYAATTGVHRTVAVVLVTSGLSLLLQLWRPVVTACMVWFREGREAMSSGSSQWSLGSVLIADVIVSSMDLGVFLYSAPNADGQGAVPWILQFITLHRVYRVMMHWGAYSAFSSLLLAFPERFDVSEPDGCIVCREEISHGQSARQLPCSHKFHSRCIQNWLANTKKCPTCREDPWRNTSATAVQSSNRHPTEATTATGSDEGNNRGDAPETSLEDEFIAALSRALVAAMPDEHQQQVASQNQREVRVTEDRLRRSGSVPFPETARMRSRRQEDEVQAQRRSFDDRSNGSHLDDDTAAMEAVATAFVALLQRQQELRERQAVTNTNTTAAAPAFLNTSETELQTAAASSSSSSHAQTPSQDTNASSQGKRKSRKSKRQRHRVSFEEEQQEEGWTPSTANNNNNNNADAAGDGYSTTLEERKKKRARVEK